MEETIYKATKDALAELGARDVSFAVEWPGDIAHGDFAVNAAMAGFSQVSRKSRELMAEVSGLDVSKEAHKENFFLPTKEGLFDSPREFAEALVVKIQDALGASVESVTVAGPGFINIVVARDEIQGVVLEAARSGDSWGKNDSKKGTSVMVEYGNPNPFKEMHIGHLMCTVIGEAVARLTASTGAKVIHDTFGGDVGPHVAKALWALQKDGVTDIASPQEIGEAYIAGSKAYEEDAEAKAAIDALNTKIYDVVGKAAKEESLNEDESTLLTLWKRGREISMEEFSRLFQILGTHFDYSFFDSDTTETGLREVYAGVERGIFEKSEGAIIYRGEKVGLNTLVFITGRGTPTYETKDIGLAFLKEEQAPTDKVIIITAIEQIGHFKIVLAALSEVAPKLAEKMQHVAHGLMQLTTGKMSSRKGNIITASELIKDMTETALERNSDPLIAQQVAVAAVKYMILRSMAGSNIIFDPEKSLSLEGDSGPYLQYALVRARAIIAKEVENSDESVPETPYLIERLITRFPKVVARAAEEYAPHHVAQYLTQLASEWNSFYAAERIVGGEYEIYKRTIAEAFITTMTNGLTFLGIPVPEKM